MDVPQRALRSVGESRGSEEIDSHGSVHHSKETGCRRRFFAGDSPGFPDLSITRRSSMLQRHSRMATPSEPLGEAGAVNQ